MVSRANGACNVCTKEVDSGAVVDSTTSTSSRRFKQNPHWLANMGKRWNRRAFAALDSLRQIWHYGRFCVAEINESITCLDNLPNSKWEETLLRCFAFSLLFAFLLCRGCESLFPLEALLLLHRLLESRNHLVGTLANAKWTDRQWPKTTTTTTSPTIIFYSYHCYRLSSMSFFCIPNALAVEPL